MRGSGRLRLHGFQCQDHLFTQGHFGRLSVFTRVHSCSSVVQFILAFISFYPCPFVFIRGSVHFDVYRFLSVSIRVHPWFSSFWRLSVLIRVHSCSSVVQFILRNVAGWISRDRWRQFSSCPMWDELRLHGFQFQDHLFTQRHFGVYQFLSVSIRVHPWFSSFWHLSVFTRVHSCSSVVQLCFWFLLVRVRFCQRECLILAGGPTAFA